MIIKAYSWLTFCVIVWGSNFVFGKILVQSFSPALLTSIRLLFIVLFLFGIAFFKKSIKRINRSEFIIILLLGIIDVYINQWSFFEGLTTADPTTSALILAISPIVTGFLAALFLKEKLTTRMLIGSIVAVIGIFFVVTKGSFSSLYLDKGLLWIVITMITFVIMIIMTRMVAEKIDPLLITLYSNIVGFVISVFFIFPLDHPVQMSSSLSDWVLLLCTAVIVHGLANLIWNSYIRYVDASKASVLSNLEPFVAMIFGLIILHKPIAGAEIIGSIFIVGGVILSTYQKKFVQAKSHS